MVMLMNKVTHRKIQLPRAYKVQKSAAVGKYERTANLVIDKDGRLSVAVTFFKRKPSDFTISHQSEREEGSKFISSLPFMVLGIVTDETVLDAIDNMNEQLQSTLLPLNRDTELHHGVSLRLATSPGGPLSKSVMDKSKPKGEQRLEDNISRTFRPNLHLVIFSVR